jgi:large subunit ribosomal protein L12
MEYVYAAMVLHAAGKKIDENNLSKVLQAADIQVNEARVKALVAALEGINIDEAIKGAVVPSAVAAPAATPSPKAEKKEEKKVEEEKKEEEALAGLAALFG